MPSTIGRDRTVRIAVIKRPPVTSQSCNLLRKCSGRRTCSRKSQATIASKDPLAKSRPFPVSSVNRTVPQCRRVPSSADLSISTTLSEAGFRDFEVLGRGSDIAADQQDAVSTEGNAAQAEAGAVECGLRPIIGKLIALVAGTRIARRFGDFAVPKRVGAVPVIDVDSFHQVDAMPLVAGRLVNGVIDPGGIRSRTLPVGSTSAWTGGSLLHSSVTHG